MNRPPPHERPSAEELRRQSQGSGRFVCRHCGCSRTRVAKTWTIEGGAIRRKRICDHCGQDFVHTTEVPCPRGLSVVVEDEEPERAVA